MEFDQLCVIVEPTVLERGLQAGGRIRGTEAMPVVFRYRGYRFHFYSNEGDPREPLHIHVRKDDADAKFWLFPTASVAYNRGFDARVLADLLDQVERRRGEIEKAWNEYFS